MKPKPRLLQQTTKRTQFTIEDDRHTVHLRLVSDRQAVTGGLYVDHYDRLDVNSLCHGCGHDDSSAHLLRSHGTRVRTKMVRLPTTTEPKLVQQQ